jgi:hypothetical protein
MKYKVVLYNNYSASDTDASGSFSFYTRQAAIDCCLSWVELYGASTALLWNGVTWAFINP